LRNDRLIAVLDLVSLLTGLVGAMLLAFVVGIPPGNRIVLSTGGRVYEPAYVLSLSQWRWGVGLIILAAILQLPKVTGVLKKSWAR
jgi:hypothetical protein